MLIDRIADACPRHRQHLALRSDLAGAGVGSEALALAVVAGDLARVRRGVYSPAALPGRAQHLVSGGVPDPGYLAHVRAALMSLGSTAMAGGRTAAVLWGFDMFVEPQVIEVVTADTRRPRGVKGVRFTRRRGALPIDVELLGLAPVRMLSAVATVIDCALSRPLREAVVIADSALRAGRVTLAELERAIAAYSHHPRGPRLRRMLTLVDPESASVLESLLRVLLLQHGLAPESQVTLTDARGRFIGRVDFLFRAQRLVVECDGRRWHDPEDARARDRVRANELERAAWRLVRVTWAEVVHQPEQTVRLLRDCLEPWPLTA